MHLLKQPNRWSCLLTSFAMVLETTCEELIEEIGHDGSQIIWPDLPEPYRRKSFHIQELKLCSYRRDKYVTEIEVAPLSAISQDKQFQNLKKTIRNSLELQSLSLMERAYDIVKDMERYVHQVHYSEGNEFLIHSLMYKNIGVLTGESLHGSSHAVAWDGEKIYDPTGPVIRAVNEFLVHSFFLVK